MKRKIEMRHPSLAGDDRHYAASRLSFDFALRILRAPVFLELPANASQRTENAFYLIREEVNPIKNWESLVSLLEDVSLEVLNTPRNDTVLIRNPDLLALIETLAHDLAEAELDLQRSSLVVDAPPSAQEEHFSDVDIDAFVAGGLAGTTLTPTVEALVEDLEEETCRLLDQIELNLRTLELFNDKDKKWLQQKTKELRETRIGRQERTQIIERLIQNLWENLGQHLSAPTFQKKRALIVGTLAAYVCQISENEDSMVRYVQRALERAT